MVGREIPGVESYFTPEQPLPDGSTRRVLSHLTVHGVTYTARDGRDMVAPDGRVVRDACRAIVGTPEAGYLLFGPDSEQPIVTDRFHDLAIVMHAAVDDCYEAVCLAELAEPAR